MRDEIGIVDVATGKLTQLTNSGAFNPAFSPNGHEIAFLTQDRRISIMSASGGSIRHIVAAPGGTYSVETPAWSPDGKDLVYAWSAPPANNLNQDLFSVSVHGGHSTQLTSTPYYSQDPSWAPAVTLCTVPKLKGQTLTAAKKLLKLRRLRPGLGRRAHVKPRQAPRGQAEPGRQPQRPRRDEGQRQGHVAHRTLRSPVEGSMVVPSTPLPPENRSVEQLSGAWDSERLMSSGLAGPWVGYGRVYVGGSG